MSGGLQRVAMVTMHTSPAATVGRGDAGGMNVTVVAVASQLASRGVEVDLLTRATAEPSAVELLPGVTLRTLAAGPLAPLPKEELPGVTDEFGEAVATIVGRTGSRYDLIHAHYWLSGLAVLPAALELGLPFVQTFHTLGAMKNGSLAPGDAPEPQRRLRSEAFLANQADAVVAVSSAEVTSLIDDSRAPAEKLWVIPPGVDTGLFTPERSVNEVRIRLQLGLEAERPLLVTAGRIQRLKGQDLAIRTLAALHALRGWAPLLVLAGESSDLSYLQELMSLAGDLGVTDDVRMVGALGREDLADLLAAASIILVPSHSETFGLVALEAASSGTPVVGYRSTGLRESVADGESGILLHSRDPAVWAEAVSSLLADDRRRERLSVSARRHAEGFTWATAGAALLALYQTLQRGGKGG